MAVQKMDIRDIPAERIPRHIAVIMDGNGRCVSSATAPGWKACAQSSRPVWNSVYNI